MDQEYFKIDEVAEKLKVTPAAIRKWIAQGKIAVVYVGADRRITGAEITAFVERSTAERGARHPKKGLGNGPKSDYNPEDRIAPGLAAPLLAG